MSLVLDNEVEVDNLKEIKVLSFAVDNEAKVIIISYALGNTVAGIFSPGVRLNLILKDDDFLDMAKIVPADGLSLYDGLKVALYDVIKSKVKLKDKDNVEFSVSGTVV